VVHEQFADKVEQSGLPLLVDVRDLAALTAI